MKTWSGLFAIAAGIFGSPLVLAAWLPLASEIYNAGVDLSVREYDLKQAEIVLNQARGQASGVPIQTLENRVQTLEKQRESAEKYQTALNQLTRKGLPLVHTNASGEKEIDSQLRDRLKKAIGDLDGFLDAYVREDAILKFFERVESNRDQWHHDTHVEPIEVHGFKGRSYVSFQIKFLIDEHDRLYVEFGDSRIGQGAGTNVYRLVRYDDWMPIALLKVRPPEDFSTHDDFQMAQRSYEKQKRIFKRLNSEPALNRQGIVKTVHVGKNIIQELYPRDFYKIIAGEFPIQLSLEDRLQLALKLTSSLATLHSLGIAHYDIKPENILVKVSEGDNPRIEEIDIADYGTAFEPAKKFKKAKSFYKKARKKYLKAQKRAAQEGQEFNEPAPRMQIPLLAKGGTPHYIAPEVIRGPSGGENGWYGKSRIEKVRNSFKADVFSMGVVLYSLFHFDDPRNDRHALWFQDYEANEYSKNGDWIGFYARRAQLLGPFLNYLRVNPPRGTIPLIDRLLAQALTWDPETRITSEAFYERLLNITRGDEEPAGVADFFRRDSEAWAGYSAAQASPNRSISAPNLTVQPPTAPEQRWLDRLLRFLHIRHE